MLLCKWERCPSQSSLWTANMRDLGVEWQGEAWSPNCGIGLAAWVGAASSEISWPQISAPPFPQTSQLLVGQRDPKEPERSDGCLPLRFGWEVKLQDWTYLWKLSFLGEVLCVSRQCYGKIFLWNVCFIKYTVYPCNSLLQKTKKT